MIRRSGWPAIPKGMRVGELAALHWSDVDDDFIHIKPNRPQDFLTYKVIEATPKDVFNLEISVINWVNED